ncbi:polyphosphate kinase 1 [Treponema sp.]|uniref:polyphosphate kinase 1 n=1 Tax=Treponema sp. TaxID=166 RepID=UPI00257D26D7|nr:polyphosphate kinase 1 [Treponema sp.]MBE6355155.1 polyphosphate kinase 1 [Treponema sp.]
MKKKSETNYKYFNRELSWVEFNYRVLLESAKKDLPLFERLKFISIASSNFNEFFQVRIASLKQALKSNPRVTDSNGYNPGVILKKLSTRIHQVVRQAYDILYTEILPECEENRIFYIRPDKYTPAQKSFTEHLFRHDIFPLLTPLRTDGDSFPQPVNLKLHAAFLLKPMENVHHLQNALTANTQNEIAALVPLPAGLERIVWLPSSDGSKQFTTLDDIITCYGKELFSGFSVTETMVFKITRDADFSVNEDDSRNFIQAMQEVLEKRQSSFAVNMVCTTTSEKLLKLIKEKLFLTDDDIYQVPALIDPSTLLGILDIEDSQKFLWPEWKHFNSPDLPKDETYWNTLRQHDVLLHVPYESFDSVKKFIKDACEDPNVLAIKMTLYRTGTGSEIVKSLIHAAKNGKQVTAFVELKARFDEKTNISWAAELEKAGAIVIYGVVNLKVHAKICLVTRKESDGLRQYVHLSTGNYNAKTARLYQDFSLFTANHDISRDATFFFNVISGYSALQTMHHLYMAPVTLKSRLIELIEREISLSTKERPGLIIAKMNSLCHKEIIDALYRASCAGVQIKLNVRGICTLVPGIPGLSENITVVSIIDRYLEHSRVFYFQNDGEEELFLSSADWMDRNLDRRIELMFPITDRNIFKTVKDTLNLYFQDNTHSHTLQKDGTWKSNAPAKKEQSVRVQEVIYKKYKKRNDSSKNIPASEFSVRRNN